MATEELAAHSPISRANIERRVAEAGFVLLLLLIFVGTSPLDDRSVASLTARNAATASGDLVRQLIFLSVFAIISYCALRKKGLAAVRAIPTGVALLLGWCLASAVWSNEPDIVARRAVLAMIFAVSVMLSVGTLGTARTLSLWRYVLAAVILCDLASVALFPQAVHLSSDVEANLAGAWRGLHAHKNSAGAFAATSALLFFYLALTTRRTGDIVLCLGSLGFLVMTRSKSSLGLLPVALAAAALYRYSWRNRLDRAIAAVLAALLLVVLALGVALQWEFFAHLLEDPQNFSGRAEIWQAELAYVRDHPLLGAGFGTFGNTGVRSPIFHYVGSGWVSQIGEGHSGYLEMLVTIGGIGFVLGLFTLVVQPFADFRRVGRIDPNFATMLFAIFVFDILHNFMESDFIEVTAVQWGQLLLIIALLRARGRDETGEGLAAWT